MLVVPLVKLFTEKIQYSTKMQKSRYYIKIILNTWIQCNRLIFKLFSKSKNLCKENYQGYNLCLGFLSNIDCWNFIKKESQCNGLEILISAGRHFVSRDINGMFQNIIQLMELPILLSALLLIKINTKNGKIIMLY